MKRNFEGKKIKILSLKSTITKFKNLLKELNSKFEQAEKEKMTNVKIGQLKLFNMRNRMKNNEKK